MSDVKDLQAVAAARVGTVLKDKWTLLRLMGIGGTGAVYEAEHRNGKRVAVKIMHEHLGGSSVQRARFMAEGHAANRVGHPAVVSVFDEDVDGRGFPFLVLEFLEGLTLAQRAERLGGRLPPEEALDFVDCLLDVLIAAHAQKILHRDIKPENLFLTTSGELKVLDFGIAQFAERALASFRTESGTLLGTPAFMSPEQASGNFDDLDERTDIWSVGATLFTLLSSELVHPAPNGNQQVALAMTRTARSLATAAPQLPRALVAVVDRALRFSKGDRWQDAKTMQRAVRILREHWAAIQSEPDRVPTEVGMFVESPASKRTTLTSNSSSGFSRHSNPGSRSRPFWFFGVGAVVLAFIAFASTRKPSIDPAPSAIASRGTTPISMPTPRSQPALQASVVVIETAGPESQAPAKSATEPSAEPPKRPKPRTAAPATPASSSHVPEPSRDTSDTELMNHRY